MVNISEHTSVTGHDNGMLHKIRLLLLVIFLSSTTTTATTPGQDKLFTMQYLNKIHAFLFDF